MQKLNFSNMIRLQYFLLQMFGRENKSYAYNKFLGEKIGGRRDKKDKADSIQNFMLALRFERSQKCHYRVFECIYYYYGCVFRCVVRQHCSSHHQTLHKLYIRFDLRIMVKFGPFRLNRISRPYFNKYRTSNVS